MIKMVFSDTSQLVAKATTKLSGDMTNLSARRDNALSSFRATLEEMKAINAETQKVVTELDALQAFISSQKDSAMKLISDNEHVSAKITEIIGD